LKKAGLVLFSLLLLLLFWRFDFRSFIISIRMVSPLALVFLLLIQVISQLLVNYQWCRIGKLMGGAYSFLKMLYINARGMIMECITPGVKIGGEVTRALLLKNELNYSTTDAATLVTIQKLVSFSSFFLINLFAFAHISNEIESLKGTAVRAIVYFVLLVLIGMLVVVFAFTQWLEDRLTDKSYKHKWAIAVNGYMLTLLYNIRILKGTRGEMLKQFLLSFTIWALFPVKMVLLVHLFTRNYDPIFLTEITYTSYMMGMIPLLPGGIGSFEATMTGLLMAMKIQPGEALAITILFRFITFWFVIIISLLYVFGWKIGERKDEIPMY
jgi:uncharacterized protein (TIRG00374 family)